MNGSTWSNLGDIYHREGRLAEEIAAWQRAADLRHRPESELLSLGYAELAARRPREALKAFDRASAILPQPAKPADNAFLANLAHGRAISWNELEDVNRAIAFEEETLRLAPNRASDWLDLARLYDREQRVEDAQRARARATAIHGTQ